MAFTPQALVDLFDEAIEKILLEGGVQTLTIGGRTKTFNSLEQLQKARASYAKLVDAEALSSGTKNPLKMFLGRPQRPS